MRGWLAFAAAAPLWAQAEVAPAPGPDVAAVLVAADRGEAGAAVLLAALGGEDERAGAAAAAVVRHEWAAPPAAFVAAVGRAPQALRRLLRELADAPRPALQPLCRAATAAAPDWSADDRLLAHAALGEPLAKAAAPLLFEALAAGSAGDGYRAAVARLSAAVADGLVGRLHQELLAGRFAVERALPLAERLSPAGAAALLGLCVQLPAAQAAPLVRLLHERQPALVVERARAALDGEIPLEPLWLPFAEPLLREPGRRARLAAGLGDAAAAPELAAAAFAALVAAPELEPPVIAYADAAEGEERLARARALLLRHAAALPAATLLGWLDGPPELALATARALLRRPALEPELVAALQRPFAAAEAAVDGPFAVAAATALVERGPAAAVEALWPQLRRAPGFADFVAALARRREPFVAALLLADLQAPPPDQEPAAAAAHRDLLRLGLVMHGDRRELRELVAHAAQREPAFVRRAAHHGRPLAEPLALQLLAAAEAHADADVAAELAAWAASAATPAVLARLQALWQPPAGREVAPELQEVALRALVQGPQRAALQQELLAALAAGPLPERLEPLGFELAAAVPAPPAAADLQFLAELVLRPPLADPAREAELAQRWPDGRGGFPLVAGIAQALRGAPPAAAAAAFAAVAAAVQQDPRHAAIAPQRLLVLWRSLEATPAVQAAVGAATAGLFLALPHGPELPRGPGHAYAWQAAVAQDDPAAAAAASRAAIATLLRDPADRQLARWCLGERDLEAQRDPWAALAAAPHRHAAEAALRAGDAAAARRALDLAREFAGDDAGTRAILATLQARLP